MKRISFMFFGLLGLLALNVSVWPSASTLAAGSSDSAVVEFTETVKLQGALLKGEYLVIHDEQRMARGEPCTYIYSGNQLDETKLVVAFHCIHVNRDKASAFKVTLTRHSTLYDLPEIQEIQFAGSTEAHRVP